MSILAKQSLRIAYCLLGLMLLVSCSQPQKQQQQPDITTSNLSPKAAPQELTDYEIIDNCEAKEENGLDHRYVVFLETDVVDNSDKAFDDIKIVGNKILDDTKDSETRYNKVEYFYFDSKSHLPETDKLCSDPLSIYTAPTYVGMFSASMDPNNKTKFWTLNTSREKKAE